MNDLNYMPIYWLFPWNPKVFYLEKFLEKFSEVDWKQGKYKISVGDHVYIYCRLKLLEAINTEKLSLDALQENGLTARPQGKQKINARLLSYIQSCFTNNIDPTELPIDEKIF